MATKKPHRYIVCDVSSFAHDHLREGADEAEDRALAAVADERAKTFNRKTALTFDKVFED